MLAKLLLLSFSVVALVLAWTLLWFQMGQVHHPKNTQPRTVGLLYLAWGLLGSALAVLGWKPLVLRLVLVREPAS